MRKMRKLFLLLCAALLITFTGCQKDEVATCSDGLQNGTETGIDCGGDCVPCALPDATIQGFVQKGPFLNGSSVQLNELDSSYTQTGVSFTTQILDNLGSFAFNTIPLGSPYVTLRADGFYFNEVCGVNSATQITLNAISDIPTDGQVNVNVLTHLEKARVEYLLANTNLSFLQAKEQALGEVLAIFNIAPTSLLDRAETLDISQSAEGDAILIAVATILQGYRNETQFSELMAGIISDIRTDGVLNNQDLGAELVLHAKALDTLRIRQNIQDRYNAIGVTVNVPNFRTYIDGFLTNTSFPASTPIVEYPTFGPDGEKVNILDPNNTIGPTNLIVNNTNPTFALSANLLEGCTELKVVVRRVDAAACPFPSVCWYLGQSISELTWEFEPLDEINRTQVLRSREDSKELRGQISFPTRGLFVFDIYEFPDQNIIARSDTIEVI